MSDHDPLWQDDEGRALRDALREGVGSHAPTLNWSAIRARAAAPERSTPQGRRWVGAGAAAAAVLGRPAWPLGLAVLLGLGLWLGWPTPVPPEAPSGWRGQAHARPAANPAEAAQALAQALRELGLEASVRAEGRCAAVDAHTSTPDAHRQALFALELAPDSKGQLQVHFCPP